MPSLAKDVQFAARSIRKTPIVSAVAVATLALGIGANSAVFTIVNTVLLKPLPVGRPERLVFASESSRQRNLQQSPVSAADYLDWKSQSRSFDGMTAMRFAAFTYSEKGGAVRVNGMQVSYDYFDVLGIRPTAGRTFTAADDRPGSDTVVVVSEGFWKRALGGDSGAVGRGIRLNSRSFTVVGVVPDGANTPFGAGEIWKPLGLTPAAATDRVQRVYAVVGRLRDGVSLAAAQAELAPISQRAAEQFPATNADWSATLISFDDAILGGPGRQFSLLLAVVAAVLIIACVNLASLFSARTNARQREIATRLALGASRRQIVQQMLAETVVLAAAGGLLGVALAYWGLPLLVQLVPQGLPRINEISIDGLTLAFTLLVSLTAGVAFGLHPAVHAGRGDLHAALQDSARGSSAGARRARFLDWLMASEVALSMLLLVSAGLLMRSFVALRSVDPGFRADRVLVNTLLVLPTDKYDTKPKRQEFFNRLFERVRALPGVETAGGITALPLQGNSGSTGFRIAGESTTERGREHGAVMNVVTPGYFETMGIPLRRGRLFSDADNDAAAKVALINDTAARRHFADRDPVGQRIYLPGQDAAGLEIVGVVGSSRQSGLAQEAKPEIFTAFAQSNASFLYVVARASGNPELLAQPIRREVAAIDPDQPVGHRTLARQIENNVQQPRLLAEMLGLFAGLALILALVGIYGVTAYGVAQRTQEIGIRMALGANPRSLVTMVVRRTVLLALAGVVVGGASALLLSRLMRQFLFGVTGSDPVTYGNTALLLVVVAAAASAIPARRAATVDPLSAMRQE